jgi:hypothetical protein
MSASSVLLPLENRLTCYQPSTDRIQRWLMALSFFGVLALLAYSSYTFAERGWVETRLAQVRSMRVPLGFEGSVMATGPVQNAVKARQYRERWYRCLGQGLVETTLLIVL